MDSQTTQALLTTFLPLAGEFGFGGAIFFIFGYTVKKVFKILTMIFSGSAVRFLPRVKKG